MNELTETIMMLAGGGLALAFKYVPKVKDWYGQRESTAQAGIMALLILLTSAGMYGLSCAGWLALLLPGVNLTCDQPGLALVIRSVLLVLSTNQATYMITKPFGKKKEYIAG